MKPSKDLLEIHSQAEIKKFIADFRKKPRKFFYPESKLFRNILFLLIAVYFGSWFADDFLGGGINSVYFMYYGAIVAGFCFAVILKTRLFSGFYAPKKAPCSGNATIAFFVAIGWWVYYIFIADGMIFLRYPYLFVAYSFLLGYLLGYAYIVRKFYKKNPEGHDRLISFALSKLAQFGEYHEEAFFWAYHDGFTHKYTSEVTYLQCHDKRMSRSDYDTKMANERKQDAVNKNKELIDKMMKRKTNTPDDEILSGILNEVSAARSADEK